MLKPKPRSLLKETVRVWVVFMEAKHWSQRYLKSGYGHVYTITPVCGLWIVLNPAISHTSVEVYPQSVPLDDIVAKGSKRVYYEADMQRRSVRRWFGPHNCVEGVKAALGLSKWWVLTPWQLYKEIS